jgi:hypothetical protein
MNSDEEDALKEEHGEVLEGVYTAGIDPKKGPVKFTQAQVAAQKAATQALPRSQTPVSGSSDDDDPNGSEHIWSQTNGCMHKNKHFRVPAATASPEKVISTPPPTSSSIPAVPPKPVSVPADPPSPKSKKPAKKAAASRKAPADQKPVPEAKASKSMETRKPAASRAGSLRPVGGSGQKDTCVAQGNPSKP